MMEKISEHVSWNEACSMRSALKHGIENIPGPGHIARLKQLARNVFEPLRAHFNLAIKIESMYRNTELNKAVKGFRNSQHLLGEAMDIDDDYGGLKNSQLFYFIAGMLVFDQLIWEFGNFEEPEWVHVSYRAEGNRNRITISFEQNGNTTYEHFKNIHDFEKFKAYLYGVH